MSDAKPAKPAKKSKPDARDGKPPDHVEVFFDVRDGSYWLRVSGRYIALGKSDLKIQLCTMGITDQEWHKADAGRLDSHNWVFWNAQQTGMIDYAGSLAGHRTGIFQDGSGRKFLVTDEARGVWEAPAKKFKPPQFFANFCAELLPDAPDGTCQLETFFCWLAFALRVMRDGSFRPGQVSVFAGPVDCGKSFVQKIITEIFGGRVGSPMRYMLQETSFNKDLCGAEHWAIEEPKSTTDIRTRIEFGNAIKECFHNREFSIHGKGKEALTLPMFRRGTISLNNEPELLMVLPPLNGSVDDKLNLFNCAVVRDAFKPYMVDGVVDELAVWKVVQAEVPAIRAWLLANYSKVPAAIVDKRFGVKAYHHPDLRAELVSFTPEARLLALIDEAFYTGAPKDGERVNLTGRAVQLERELRGSDLKFQFERMLDTTWKLGSYLGKLAKAQPERVSKRVADGYTHWTIKPPSSCNKQNL